jgi:hypothetical protein
MYSSLSIRNEASHFVLVTSEFVVTRGDFRDKILVDFVDGVWIRKAIGIGGRNGYFRSE